MHSDPAYSTDEPIAALATPLSESALAVIRTSGKGTVQRFRSLFRPFSALEHAAHRQAVFGSIINPDCPSEVIDEVVALVFRQPGGYTGEEAVELTCHGSLPGIQAILTLLNRNGFRQALPGEFTFRAFMNGKLDLTQAEAVEELIRSKSKRGHELALNRLSGALSRQINEAKQQLLSASAIIELQLDYPGDELDDPVSLPIAPVAAARTQLKHLLESYAVGKRFRDGVRIALCGQTNSGKSSLFNAFLKEDRSIVSDIHGTTRDYVEAWISLGGIPIRLFDTAGIRDTVDAVEAEGIRRTQQILDSADLVLYVIDGTIGLQAGEADRISELCLTEAAAAETPPDPSLDDSGSLACTVDASGESARTDTDTGTDSRVLCLWNKIDLPSARSGQPANTVGISAVTGEGFSSLSRQITQRLSCLLKGAETEGSVIIHSQRQHKLLSAAVDALDRVYADFCSDESGAALRLDGIAVDLNEALNALGQLTGEVTSADILNEIFSHFCVGK